jgi:hypothetical protein
MVNALARPASLRLGKSLLADAVAAIAAMFLWPEYLASNARRSRGGITTARPRVRDPVA